MNKIIKDVSQIKFYLKTTEEIRKTSVCEITEIDLYERNEPKKGSLMDTRMGPNNKDICCQTCKNDINICPGHFGHIELAVPVYNVLYINYIKKLLEVTCCYCSNLLINYNDKNFIEKLKQKQKNQKFKMIQNFNKNNKIKICYNCSRIQPKYQKNGIGLNQIFSIEENNKQKELKKNLSAKNVLKIFKNIKNTDIELLGLNIDFSRPEALIFEVLPVPPPCIRPSVKYSTNMRSEDDLIFKYLDILKANHNIINKIKKNSNKHIDDYIEYLQYHVATLIDNNIKSVSQSQHRSGRPLKCLKDRIKGKEARIRGNLLGKRVDFSARTVVGPDPSISIHELGVPYIVCKKITIPETVNKYNIEKLQKNVNNGPNKYPGANYIIKEKNGEKITLDLRFVKHKLKIEEGDIVERHLMDVDYILFNRQPSLHKMSMMGHKVKPIIGKSFRLNPAVCLEGNSLVHTPKGLIKIKDIKEGDMIYSINKENDKYISKVEKFHKIVPKDYGFKCYEIETENGYKIKATSEHPFCTKNGNIKVSDLNINDMLIIEPNKLPLYEEDRNGLIKINDIIDINKKIKYPFYEKNMIREFKKYNLLNITGYKKILCSKLIGHLFGDGTLWMGYGRCHLTFRCKEEYDIKTIQKDLFNLGIKCNYFLKKSKKECYITEKNGKKKCIKTDNGLYVIDLHKKVFSVFFHILGVPIGDRVKQSYNIPEWIMNGNKQIKREFLRSFYGADGDTPKMRTEHLFFGIRLTLAKVENISPNKLINDITKLLNEFNIEYTLKKGTYGNIRKSGLKSIIYRININKSYNYFKNIGYNYSLEKEYISRQFIEYYNFKEIFKKNNKINICKKYIDIPNFLSFKEWKNIYTSNEKVCYNKIISIKEIELDYAYDITTNDENHNFISNNFMVKNCQPYNADFDGDKNSFCPQQQE